ncbi:MAG: hypothetical protein N2746_08050 [Deltaproteobacteria bacterium]|nr:hypothetical protein [Deltaproteobacteria bacterium]
MDSMIQNSNVVLSIHHLELVHVIRESGATIHNVVAIKTGVNAIFQTNMCVECLINIDCGILGFNYICCNNQNIRGDCYNSNECILNHKGDICYNHHCRKMCKEVDECSLLTIYSDCCSNIDSPPISILCVH